MKEENERGENENENENERGCADYLSTQFYSTFSFTSAF